MDICVLKFEEMLLLLLLYMLYMFCVGNNIFGFFYMFGYALYELYFNSVKYQKVLFIIYYVLKVFYYYNNKVKKIINLYFNMYYCLLYVFFYLNINLNQY